MVARNHDVAGWQSNKFEMVAAKGVLRLLGRHCDLVAQDDTQENYAVHE